VPRSVPAADRPWCPTGNRLPEQRAGPADDVHDELIGSVPRFRFLMFPSGMFVIPIIILVVLCMLGFGFCVIPIRL
jgi:hypothetical protein